MYRKMIVATIAAVTLTGLLSAEEPAPGSLEARIEKLGALRARIGVKITETGRLFDGGINGTPAANQQVSALYNEMRADVTRRFQAEVAKAPDARDQALVDSLNAKGQKLDAIWNKQIGAWQAYVRDIGESSGYHQNLALCNNYLSATDTPWLRVGLDPDPLIAAFSAMDKRLDELKVTASKVIDDFKKGCAEREGQIKE